MLHREGAIETLLRAWDHTRLGEAGDEVIIAGSSGVGKTAIACPESRTECVDSLLRIRHERTQSTWDVT
jgi:hypothetical protein